MDFFQAQVRCMLNGIFMSRESEKNLPEDSRGIPLSWLITEDDKGLIVSLAKFVFGT